MMKATFGTKIITTINPRAKGWPWWGRKAAVTSRSPYIWSLKVQRTSGTRLVLPLICIVLVMQEQTPTVTPNATINVVRPLNMSKCQCHLTITMPVTATIIVTCQHMCKTTVPLQLNRLQQSTFSWYWRSRSWSQTAVGQQDDRIIQQLPVLLAHMPKSDYLCNCAHECIRCNVAGHHCECFPALKKGMNSWSYRHCVPAHLEFDEITNMYNWLPVQFLHIYHAQDGRLHWVND